MTTVVKLGGSLLDDRIRRTLVLRGIAARWAADEDLVVVHGGGKHIDTALARVGIAKRTHAGLRITDEATLAIVISVLTGEVNKMLVAELARLGVRAAGVSGCDAGTLVATPHPPVDGVDLGAVGRVTVSDPTLCNAMLSNRMLPIVASVAISANGALLNVNADSAAAAIAAALGARELLFLTDVAGLLDHKGALVPSLDVRRAEELLASGAVTGGMRPKLHAALAALESGVGRVAIGEEGGTHVVAA